MQSTKIPHTIRDYHKEMRKNIARTAVGNIQTQTEHMYMYLKEELYTNVHCTYKMITIHVYMYMYMHVHSVHSVCVCVCVCVCA